MSLGKEYDIAANNLKRNPTVNFYQEFNKEISLIRLYPDILTTIRVS